MHLEVRLTIESNCKLGYKYWRTVDIFQIVWLLKVISVEWCSWEAVAEQILQANSSKV